MAKRASKGKSASKSAIVGSPITKAVVRPSDKFSVSSYTMSDMLNVSVMCMDVSVREGFYDNLIVLGLIIVIMVQIRLSCKGQDNQYADSLDSYKFYKKRFISATPGRSWCAGIAISEAIEFIQGDMDEVLIAYTNFEITPCSKVGKPNGSNYGAFISYRMTQILGVLQSCPGTNIKMFGLTASCIDWDLDRALEFIVPGRPIPVEGKQQLTEMARSIFLTDNGGIPTDKITFKEDRTISSKLESAIFEDLFVRTKEPAPLSATVGPDGTLPDNPLTIEQIKLILTPTEFVMYNVARRQGNKVVLQKLNRKVIEKSAVTEPGVKE